MAEPKVFFYDIETAPIEAYVWGTRDQFIAPNQIKRDWYIMSWAAKWLGSKSIMQQDLRHSKNPENDKTIVSNLTELLDEADIVVTQNGVRFDNKKVNARSILFDSKPRGPFRNIDVFKLAKRRFGFTFNSLEFLAKTLRTEHQKLVSRKYHGMELWTECLKGNQDAWREMATYNKMDVIVLEEVYDKLKAWETTVSFAPHRAAGLCTHCGSDDLEKRGFKYTKVGQFQQYRCRPCGVWMSDGANLSPKGIKRL